MNTVVIIYLPLLGFTIFVPKFRTSSDASHKYNGDVSAKSKMPAAEEKPRLEARLLLVSNRLPITIKRSADGKYDFSMSSGGLVTGLSGLSKSTTFQWYGWPGLEVPGEEAKDLTTRLKDEYGAIPVFVDDELADKHYNGFSSMFLVQIFTTPRG